MSTRHLLVVTTAPVDGRALRHQVEQHAGVGDARIHIVAPASDVSRLQWLANDEDEARAEAADVAERAAHAVEEPAGEVHAEVGDTDPVQAIEDALRTFPADELIVVSRRGDEAGWLERGSAEKALERFGLPVTHLAVDDG